MGIILFFMKLMGLGHTKSLCDIGKHWISIFAIEVEQANWRCLDDIVKVFPRLQHIKENNYRISILGTSFFLLLKINFSSQMVLIKEVKSFTNVY